MNDFYMLFVLFLLLTVSAGLLRILLGPTAADRMMAAQLFGTCGIAILLVFSRALQNEVLLDIALIFALLATLSVMTFVYRALHALSEEGEHDDLH